MLSVLSADTLAHCRCSSSSSQTASEPYNVINATCLETVFHLMWVGSGSLDSYSKDIALPGSLPNHSTDPTYS